jgi:hypothetical protein
MNFRWRMEDLLLETMIRFLFGDLRKVLIVKCEKPLTDGDAQPRAEFRARLD